VKLFEIVKEEANEGEIKRGDLKIGFRNFGLKLTKK